MSDLPESRRTALRRRNRARFVWWIVFATVLLVLLTAHWVVKRGALAKGCMDHDVSTLGPIAPMTKPRASRVTPASALSPKAGW